MNKWGLSHSGFPGTDGVDDPTPSYQPRTGKPALMTRMRLRYRLMILAVACFVVVLVTVRSGERDQGRGAVHSSAIQEVSIPLLVSADDTLPIPEDCVIRGDGLSRRFLWRMCKLAIGVRRDESVLTLQLRDPETAATMRARTMASEQWLLGVQAEFQSSTGERITTTRVFYGRIRLATAQTQWTGEERVQW